MYKCKNLCDITKEYRCCKECEKNKTCRDRCYADPVKCDQSFLQESTATEMPTVFENKALVLMKGIAEIDKAKKALDAEDAELRAKLEQAMKEFGIKKIDNEILSVTFVDETTRTTVDGKKLEQDLPEIFKKYAKTSVVKASVRIKVK